MVKIRGNNFLILGVFFLSLGLYFSIPDNNLRIIFCDVGQGDGAIVSKGNWQFLIDVGADNGKMERCLDRHLSFWDKKIEGVIISHWDIDHSGALSCLSKIYKVEKLYESVKSGEELEQKIYTEILRSGDIIKYGEIRFEVVYPDVGEGLDNENSLVVVLDYKGKRFMFSGDAEMRAEGKMMNWWRNKVDGLKVSHHGSNTATSREWLDLLNPSVAVISVGENRYGHPSQEVIKKLNDNWVRIHRTDKEGEIILGWK